MIQKQKQQQLPNKAKACLHESLSPKKVSVSYSFTLRHPSQTQQGYEETAAVTQTHPTEDSSIKRSLHRERKGSMLTGKRPVSSTYCLINCTASSYFIPHSMRARATRTGALKRGKNSTDQITPLQSLQMLTFQLQNNIGLFHVTWLALCARSIAFLYVQHQYYILYIHVLLRNFAEVSPLAAKDCFTHLSERPALLGAPPGSVPEQGTTTRLTLLCWCNTGGCIS